MKTLLWSPLEHLEHLLLFLQLMCTLDQYVLCPLGLLNLEYLEIRTIAPGLDALFDVFNTRSDNAVVDLIQLVILKNY